MLVATILDTSMTLIKKKITEVESIVNKADKRKTAGKIYLPKDLIGKKVKTILLSSLIVIALVVFTQHQVNAELVNNGYQGYIPDETRRQINQALINDQVKKVTPIFEQQCKAELGLPLDHILTLMETMSCANTVGKLMNGSSLNTEVNKSLIP
jgi:putative transposon-encoded protein